jgi:hypothetical protein
MNAQLILIACGILVALLAYSLNFYINREKMSKVPKFIFIFFSFIILSTVAYVLYSALSPETNNSTNFNFNITTYNTRPIAVWFSNIGLNDKLSNFFIFISSLLLNSIEMIMVYRWYFGLGIIFLFILANISELGFDDFEKVRNGVIYGVIEGGLFDLIILIWSYSYSPIWFIMNTFIAIYLTLRENRYISFFGKFETIFYLLMCLSALAVFEILIYYIYMLMHSILY